MTPVLSHGVSQLVALKKLPRANMVIGASVLGQKNGSNHALAAPVVLQQTATPGQVKITCYFFDSTATRVQVAIALVPEGQSSSAAPSTGTWTAISGYLNAWVAFGGASFVPGYFKDAFGRVHLRGQISAGAIGAAAFVLPTGYRPSAEVDVPVVSNNLFGAAFIQANGNFVPSVGSNVWFSMDGITFDTR